MLGAGDEQRGRKSGIAAGEYARNIGRERHRIDLERSRRRGFDSILRFEERKVGRLPDRENDRVGVDRARCDLVEFGLEATRRRRIRGRIAPARFRPPCRRARRFAWVPTTGMKLTPSSRATSSSSRPCSDFIAGISAPDSRLTTVTSSAPRRAASRATSSATRIVPASTRSLHPRSNMTSPGTIARTAVRAASIATRPPPTTTTLPAERNPVAAIDIEQIVDRLDDAVGIGVLDRNCAPARRADREEDRSEALLQAARELRSSRSSGVLVAELDAHRFDLGGPADR